VNERKFEKIIVAVVLALPFAALGLVLSVMSAEAFDKHMMPIIYYAIAVWLMGIVPVGLVLGLAFRLKFDRERPGDSAIAFLTVGLAWPALIYYYLAKQIAYWAAKLRQRQKTQ
jgi:hypothetical protein